MEYFILIYLNILSDLLWNISNNIINIFLTYYGIFYINI